ncbi:MAG: hypothetical protein ACR2GY_07720 [Phycisphaerales bacterium]
MACTLRHVIVAAVLLALSASVAAQTERAPSRQPQNQDFLHPVVGEETWAGYVDQLNPADENVRALLVALHVRYVAEIRTLKDAVLLELEDAGVWRLADAQRQPGFDASAFEREFRAIQNVFRKALRECSARFETLLNDAGAIVGESIPQMVQRSALLWLQRRVFLDGLYEGAEHWSFAGEGVDVLALRNASIAEATPEFAWLVTNQPDDERTASLREEYDAVVAAYEDETARFLDQHAMTLIELSMQADARGFGNDAERQEQRRVDRERLLELHRSLNDRTARKLGNIIEQAVDEDARHQWLHRFLTASAPALARRDSVDRMLDWLRSALPADAIGEAAGADLARYYSNFLRTRQRQQLQHAAAIREARLDQRLPPSPQQIAEGSLRSAIDKRMRLSAEAHEALHALASRAGLAEQYASALPTVRRQPDAGGWPSDY